MEFNFHIKAKKRDSFDIWHLTPNRPGIDGREPDATVRRLGAGGYWETCVNGDGGKEQIRSGKSRGGCILAGLEHLGGF